MESSSRSLRLSYGYFAQYAPLWKQCTAPFRELWLFQIMIAAIKPLVKQEERTVFIYNKSKQLFKSLAFCRSIQPVTSKTILGSMNQCGTCKKQTRDLSTLLYPCVALLQHVGMMTGKIKGRDGAVGRWCSLAAGLFVAMFLSQR